MSPRDDLQTQDLEPIERRTLALCRTINERPLLKQAQRLFLHQIGRRWVRICASNLLDVRGLEHARALRPDKGVLVCSNHRSFFDMYVISAVFLNAHVPWFQHQYFPVRSNFFYERWLGLGINLIMAGGAMYPPIFRDTSRAELNKQSVDRIIGFLQEPGVVVGMHPEGTRGKGPDPYELLRAQPGVGQLALQAGAPVVPVWINGLSNELTRQLASNFGPPSHRGERIVVRVGPPVDLDDLRAKPGRVALYKRAADRILDDIRALAEQARAEA